MPAPIRRRGSESIELQVELLTWQFGGGSEARVVDADRWLRGPAVRGALRFWWRALHAHLFANVETMFRAESRLFGSAAEADAAVDPVDLSVSCDPAPAAALQDWDPPPGSSLNVAWFPAAPMGQEGARLLRPGQRARLRLSRSRSLDDAEWAQVRRALQAWIVFGGSGARTRRASGMVGAATEKDARAAGVPATRAELRAWIHELPRGGSTHPFFHVSDRVGVWVDPRAGSDGTAAQTRVLDVVRDIRQDRPHPRSWQGRDGWGRTRWPEADAVRLADGTHAVWSAGGPPTRTHAPDPKHVGRAPRAHLGLPMRLHFKDDRVGRDRDGVGRLVKAEPADAEFRPAGATRYPSPLVVAVHRLFGADAGFAGLALLTRSRLSGPVVVDRLENARFSAGDPADVERKVAQSFSSAGFERWDS